MTEKRECIDCIYRKIRYNEEPCYFCIKYKDILGKHHRWKRDVKK